MRSSVANRPASVPPFSMYAVAMAITLTTQSRWRGLNSRLRKMLLASSSSPADHPTPIPLIGNAFEYFHLALEKSFR